MRQWANDVGCSARIILGEDATRSNVLDTLEATIERLVPGDLFLMTFAGHGVSLRGAATDPDGWDEAWCLYDGVLLDDEIHDLLAAVPEGCRVVVLTDACFAAGIVDQTRPAVGAPVGVREEIIVDTKSVPGVGDPMQPMTPLMPRAPRTRSADNAIAQLLLAGRIPPGPIRRRGRRERIRAEVVSLAAAAENELAYEGPNHGVFTAALLRVLERVDSEELSYEDLIEAVDDIVSVQQPALGVVGATERTVRIDRALKGAAPTAILQSNR